MMNYRQPFEGSYGISQHFGEKDTDPKGHTGIDYLCPLGTPVLASEAGQVIFSGWNDTGYGYCVIIRHEDGNATLYAHLLSTLKVTTGQIVRRGQVIGYSGSTGNSTGPHLHFEARGKDGKAFDPMALPLHSVDDSIQPAVPDVPNDLKGADVFHAGDLVKVTAPAGVKAFFSAHFGDYTTYPQGTPFYYTGDTKERKVNGQILTYMRVVPATFSVWIAVNDGETQLLDNTE